MKFNFQSKTGGSYHSYEVLIVYYYHDGEKIRSSNFESTELFEEFMNECHPGIPFDEVLAKFGKAVELVSKLSNNGIWEEKHAIKTVNCYLAGDLLVSCMSCVGIHEKMAEYYEGRKKINEGYLQTFLANGWSFNDKSTTFVTFTYYYDAANSEKPYKIHVFKNKVAVERPNGTVCSVIVADRFWVHYGGKKKPE